MDRREFLLNLTGITGLVILPPLIYELDFKNSGESDRGKKLQSREDEKTQHFSKFSDEKIRHVANIKSNFLPELTKASNIFGTSLEIILSMIGVEDGKPYANYPTGLRVDSGTGCKGLGQISYGAFAESCIWSRNITNKSPIVKIDPNKGFYNSLFRGPETNYDGKSLNSIQIQIDTMNSYMNRLSSLFGENIPFAILAYNIGMGTTAMLIHRYLELQKGKDKVVHANYINFSALGNFMTQNTLSIESVTSNPGVKSYFEKLRRQNSNLKYANLKYYNQVIDMRDELRIKKVI